MSDTIIDLETSADDKNYVNLVNDLKNKILQAQRKAVLSVNTELIRLYWEIGRSILERQDKEGWGSKIIDRLSMDLQKSFPEVKGFSPRNLKYMRKFAESYPDFKIVQEALAQLTWYHNIALMDKLDSSRKRLWYASQTIENGWSRNVLVHQIESGLYERQAVADKTTNFGKTLPAPQSDLALQMIKDPYKFDFLTIGQEAKEKEVDDILRHPDDNPSIGLILCKTKNKVTAEYALRDMTKPIGVSEYKLLARVPKELRKSLPSVEELEAEFEEDLKKLKE